MRLAAQGKCGFYPANPLAIDLIAKHLKCRPPDPAKKYDTCLAIDPCCGKGAAIKQLTEAVGIAQEQIYTVELSKERWEEAKELMPKHNYLPGPSSFFGAQITGFSFGLAYVNPPFDSELGGGGREELRFTSEATRLLVHKGVLVLVCPAKTLSYSLCDFLDSHFENIAVYKFPDGLGPDGKPIRPFNEIVVFAQKRATAIPDDMVYQHGVLRKAGFRYGPQVHNLPPLGAVQPKSWSNGNPSYAREEELRVWEIAHAWKPHTFRKIKFTDEELQKAIADSPLHIHLDEVPVIAPCRPPLPLDRGHLGLILASGMLDGTVEGPWGVHVVRGSSHKVLYENKEASTSDENPDTGAVTTKIVESERMITVIRAVEQDGEIRTFSNEPKEQEEDE